MSNYKCAVLVMSVLLAPGLCAQLPKSNIEPLTDQKNWTVKILPVRHADVNRLRSLFTGVFQADIKADNELKVLIVRAPEATMTVIEDAVKRLDVPPPAAAPGRNVDLTAYLLVATEQAGPAAVIPADLQPVIKQLRSTFPYQGYRLLDTLSLRAREDTEAEVSGIPPQTTGDTPPSIYTFRFRSARITADERGKVVTLRALRLGLRVAIKTSTTADKEGKPGASFSYVDTGISTDVDLREGQKVVVGKTNIEGPDKALFLVVTAKVID